MQVQYSVIFCLFVTAMGCRHPKVIVLSVGGLRLDLVKSASKIQKNLELFASAEYLLPVMPTKGPVNLVSIATGLYADGHGVIDNCKYDEPAGRCDYGQRDPTKMPIWIENQKKGGISAVMNWPGVENEFENKKQLTYFKNYEDDHEQDRKVQIYARIQTIMDWISRKHKPANLVMAYYGELDKVLHEDSVHSKRGQEELRYAEYFIDQLIFEVKKERTINDVNLIILGSHGGKTVDQKDGIQINEILKGEQVCHFVAMGANAIVTPNDGQLSEVHKILEEYARTTEGEIKYRVYYQKDMPEIWHLKEMPLFEKKIFLVANNGYFFWNDYLDGIKNKQLSEHEKFVATVDGYWKYTEDDRDIHTFFMAMGPMFKPEKQVPAFNTTDVYPLLRKLLKLPENENQKLNDAVQEFLNPETGYIEDLNISLKSMINTFILKIFQL